MTRVAEAAPANVAADMFRDVIKKCEKKAGVIGYNGLQKVRLSTLAEIILRDEKGDYEEAEKIYRKLSKNSPPYKETTSLSFIYGSGLLESIWKQGY